MIRARNEYNENRKSGLDEFDVSVVDSNLEVVPIEIKDNKDGTYEVTYTVPKEDKYKINVKLKEDNQTVDIRGSPITV